MQKMVLLIDDDKDEWEILSAAVSQADPACSCIWAPGTEQASRILQNVLPDIILLDYRMPFMDGLVFLSYIRSKEVLAQVPVYLYSTSLTPDLVARAEQCGVNGFLEKTGDIRMLTGKLKQLLTGIHSLML